MTNDWWLRVWVELTAPRVRDERGDVPGWVMITLMTATMVALIWGFSEGQFKEMLQKAFDRANK